MDHQATAAGELDAQELLHLALKAMDEQRDAEAISLLKRGISLAPDDGRLHYLLGAMHAQLQLYERAIEEMQRAVALAPHIDMAHFQLGLLLLTSGQVDAARAAWAALDALQGEHPLRLFMAGLLELVDDEFDRCIEHLRRGIELNAEQPALNRDMGRVMEAAEAARARQMQTPGAAPEASARHVLLAGYRPSADENR
jgi:tetratricopeptide (TPR) repeat protein